MCAARGGPAYLVCGAGAVAGGQQQYGGLGELGGLVRQKDLQVVKDWLGQRRGLYLGEQGARQRRLVGGGWLADASRERPGQR